MSATNTNLGVNTVPCSSQFSNKAIIHISMNLVLTLLFLVRFFQEAGKALKDNTESFVKYSPLLEVIHTINFVDKLL